LKSQLNGGRERIKAIRVSGLSHFHHVSVVPGAACDTAACKWLDCMLRLRQRQCPLY
jgi:hypothetical protein